MSAAWALYISFETCYKVPNEQLFSTSIQKYNISMLLRLNVFVHQFSEYGLIFATCKRNYAFSSYVKVCVADLVVVVPYKC